MDPLECPLKLNVRGAIKVLTNSRSTSPTKLFSYNKGFIECYLIGGETT